MTPQNSKFGNTLFGSSVNEIISDLQKIVPDECSLSLNIGLHLEICNISVEISDNRIGIPGNFISLITPGMTIIRSLVKQSDRTMRIKRDNGISLILPSRTIK